MASVAKRAFRGSCSSDFRDFGERLSFLHKDSLLTNLKALLQREGEACYVNFVGVCLNQIDFDQAIHETLDRSTVGWKTIR